MRRETAIRSATGTGDSDSRHATADDPPPASASCELLEPDLQGDSLVLMASPLSSAVLRRALLPPTGADAREGWLSSRVPERWRAAHVSFRGLRLAPAALPAALVVPPRVDIRRSASRRISSLSDAISSEERASMQSA
eukprot:678743-Prymnesium_polylepis.1